MPKEIDGVRFYNVKELAGLMEVQERTITQWLREGKIPAKKLGAKWFISETALRKSLEPDPNETYSTKQDSE